VVPHTSRIRSSRLTMCPACAISAASRSNSLRDKAISRLGFAARRGETPNAYGILLHAAVLLYVGIWLIFLILPAQDNNIGVSPLVAVITINVLGALAIAILPKRRWGFANAGLRQKTPVPFVIGAGACAVLFAVCVNLFAGSLLLGGWEGALKRLSDGAPYLHSPFFTAATVAWLVQDHRWIGTASARRRRLLDAATLGAMWFVSTLIARVLLADNAEAFFGWQMPVSMLIGFAFGAVLGYSIPGSVRDERCRPSAAAFTLPLSDFQASSVIPQGAEPATPVPSLATAGERAVA